MQSRNSRNTFGNSHRLDPRSKTSRGGSCSVASYTGSMTHQMQFFQAGYAANVRRPVNVESCTFIPSERYASNSGSLRQDVFSSTLVSTAFDQSGSFRRLRWRRFLLPCPRAPLRTMKASSRTAVTRAPCVFTSPRQSLSFPRPVSSGLLHRGTITIDHIL